MVDVTLKGLSAEQLIAVADLMLRQGKADVAQALYESLIARYPTAPRLRSRLPLARRASPRVPIMLDALQALEQMKAQVYVGEGIATWLKTHPFMEDAKFLRLADEHHHLGAGVYGWHWNLQVALWAAQRALGLPGDFVELGVFRGHTALFLAEYLEFAAAPKQWWLYDTFEGIPDDQLAPGWEQANQDLYRETFSFEEVRDRFARFPNIRVTKGRAPEVLAETSPEAISFLHVDLNNPTAEIGALEVLFDRVCPGGVVLLDDFGWGSARTQYEAELPWFAARGQAPLTLPTGQGLVIKL